MGFFARHNLVRCLHIMGATEVDLQPKRYHSSAPICSNGNANQNRQQSNKESPNVCNLSWRINKKN